jgi:cyanophycin synthetase
MGTSVPVTIHRTSEPGHWVVAYPWREREKAELVAEAAYRLAEQQSDRLFERAVQRILAAGATPPEWITDEQRRAAAGGVPLISISGTNGKSTTTRMITHIGRRAGKSVGTTTTDGVMVDEKIVEPGDYTGPLGAQAVLKRPDVQLAVLETARGGILLRGLGYESNDASVLTNISADHLDLQGVHTLPELAEVKSVICRVTRPSGAVVLNADDPLVAGVARWVHAPVFLFSVRGTGRRLRAHLARGGRAFVLDDGWIVEWRGEDWRRRIVRADELPATLGGLARHNIANALAAAAGARAVGLPYRAIADGLRDFSNSPDLMPGRLNLYINASRLVIVDYAHNEAGLSALFDTAEALVGERSRRRATVSAIVGTAGDRPDDALRAIGRVAAQRSDQVAIKESLTYLRGRTRASVIGELKEGLRAGGMAPASVPVYESEPQAIRGELETPGRLAATDDGEPRIVLLMCHHQRDEVEAYLARARFTPVDDRSLLRNLLASPSQT